MQPTYLVYIITCTTTDKKYVGITTRSLKTRWIQHQQKNSTCRYLKHAIAKHGSDAFKIEPVFCAFTAEGMIEVEAQLIESLGTLAPGGYNLRTGGQWGKLSEETLKLCSAASKRSWQKTGRKERYSEMMKQRWAEAYPDYRERLLAGTQEYVEQKRRPLVSYNVFTGELTQFACVGDADKFGFSNGNIYQVLRGRSSIAYDCVWFYEEEGRDYKQAALDYLNSREYYEHKPVVAVDKKTGEETLYQNFRAIPTHLRLDIIRMCLRGKKPSYAGLKWRFCE